MHWFGTGYIIVVPQAYEDEDEFYSLRSLLRL